MKKTYIALCIHIVAFALVACTPGGSPTETTTTTIFEEPGRKPIRTTELGLKVGHCKRDASILKWEADSWPGQVPACVGSVAEGKSCVEPGFTCSVGAQKFTCREKGPMTCHGWVYEIDIHTGKNVPMKDASVDLWSMTVCMIGNGPCKPVFGPVKTNEFGYYEIQVNNIMGSTNYRGYKDGYYGTCGEKKPSCTDVCSTGGTLEYENGMETKPVQLMKITAQSCN